MIVHVIVIVIVCDWDWDCVCVQYACVDVGTQGYMSAGMYA